MRISIKHIKWLCIEKRAFMAPVVFVMNVFPVLGCFLLSRTFGARDRGPRRNLLYIALTFKKVPMLLWMTPLLELMQRWQPFLKVCRKTHHSCSLARACGKTREITVHTLFSARDAVFIKSRYSTQLVHMSSYLFQGL